jgi:ATP-dependent RNA circularization protein (DNA/RNA ligase family)
MEIYNTFTEITQLEELVSDLDYLLNEGVVMKESDADQLIKLGEQLALIGKSFNDFRP